MIAVKTSDLFKKFRIYHEKPALVNILKRKRCEEIWALRNINLHVKEGETVGIIGRNGSGKSTLLKILCGVMSPTSGEATMQGRIASLLELGAGFHPELTGRENIYLNASIMNCTSREIKSRFDEIVSFAQLEKFIDVPLYTYSTGMYVRLGFSIAVHTNFDILVVDEILSVGDIGFQEKCIDKIMEFKNSGKTIIFVTHDMVLAEKISDRIFWLENGLLKERKEKQWTIDSYIEVISKETVENFLEKERSIIDLSRNANGNLNIKSDTGIVNHNASLQTGAVKEIRPNRIDKIAGLMRIKLPERWGTGEVEILEVNISKGKGKSTRIFKTGDAFMLSIKFSAQKRIKNPIFGVAIYCDDGKQVTGQNTKFSGHNIRYIDGKGYVEYEIPSLPLLKGTYLLTAAIYDYTNLKPFDHHEKLYKFKVIGGNKCKEKYGIVQMPSKWNMRIEK